MKGALVIAGLCLVSSIASADTANCQNVYVGRIWVEKGMGLYRAVFLNDPSASTGSYWVSFSTWSGEDKKSALAVLTAAKISQHRVNVTTDQADGCGIQTGQREATSVFLANNQ